MGLKIFMASFMMTSILFFLLFIPTRLTVQFSTLRPPVNYFSVPPKSSKAYPVTFAYLISASKGDVVKLKRLMKVLYHPGNYYLIHVDYGAPQAEHRAVAEFVASDPVFGQVGNVWVVGKPNLVTYRGPTMLATTLHAMAMLLRTCQWDWFINLSASDYPLVTQDGMLTWYHSECPPKSSGSAWTILSRSFAEYCIVGWENLPRTLLLYYTNFVSSPEGYFQTVICNSEDYKNTTVNHDLHYITWDNPPKQHPRSLGLKDYRRMVLTSRPFARKFKRNDPVLDKIDRDLLKRYHGKFSYGGWCSQGGKYKACSGLRTENYGVLRPGPSSRRLKNLLTKLLSDKFFHKQQCR
ncbi:hypothetical protein JHK85_054141 [Glycine max]|nr:hypothetical protein JHK86_053194 [Glycine max]KAG4927589.1 hypothetical protein JHK85_054075 [Glycine max]KAG4927655.1 hypothetical protein JHK85_054141 [Glycine max]